MLKLKLQYFGYLMQTDASLEKSLMLGKTERRKRGHQRMKWMGKLHEMVRDSVAWQAVVHGVMKSRTQLGTENNNIIHFDFIL